MLKKYIFLLAVIFSNFNLVANSPHKRAPIIIRLPKDNVSDVKKKLNFDVSDDKVASVVNDKPDIKTPFKRPSILRKNVKPRTPKNIAKVVSINNSNVLLADSPQNPSTSQDPIDLEVANNIDQERLSAIIKSIEALINRDLAKKIEFNKYHFANEKQTGFSKFGLKYMATQLFLLKSKGIDIGIDSIEYIVEYINKLVLGRLINKNNLDGLRAFIERIQFNAFSKKMFKRKINVLLLSEDEYERNKDKFTILCKIQYSFIR